jgi:hypothetical protein
MHMKLVYRLQLSMVKCNSFITNYEIYGRADTLCLMRLGTKLGRNCSKSPSIQNGLMTCGLAFLIHLF